MIIRKIFKRRVSKKAVEKVAKNKNTDKKITSIRKLTFAQQNILVTVSSSSSDARNLIVEKKARICKKNGVSTKEIRRINLRWLVLSKLKRPKRQVPQLQCALKRARLVIPGLI